MIKRKKSILSNVGYWVVIMAGLWVQNATADVVKINVSPVYTNPSNPWQGFSHYAATCPNGYVLTGASGVTNWESVGESMSAVTITPELNSNTNSTSAIFRCTQNSGVCPSNSSSAFIICAKVCN